MAAKLLFSWKITPYCFNLNWASSLKKLPFKEFGEKTSRESRLTTQSEKMEEGKWQASDFLSHPKTQSSVGVWPNSGSQDQGQAVPCITVEMLCCISWGLMLLLQCLGFLQHAKLQQQLSLAVALLRSFAAQETPKGWMLFEPPPQLPLSTHPLHPNHALKHYCSISPSPTGSVR